MIIDSKSLAKNIYENIKKEISKQKEKPCLAIILVWENSASLRYVEQKKKWAEYVGMDFKLIKYDSKVSEREVIEKIRELNNDEKVHWFMVQLPLPEHISDKKVINNINPKKDIDGFTPKNLWKVMIWDENCFIPCTPAGIMEIIKNQKIDLEGKIACVVGRSNIVWKPISALLTNAWATVIHCNSKTKWLKKYTTMADIVIMATWNPKLLKVDMIKVWATVIDVWFTVVDGKIFGDADTKLIDLAGNNITPVPGWVWVMTVAMLIKNTLKAFVMAKK